MDSFNLITSSLFGFLPLFVGAAILGWFVRRVRSIDENLTKMNHKLTSIDNNLMEIAANLKANNRRDYF